MKKVNLVFFVVFSFLISACGKNESVNNQTGNAPDDRKQESISETTSSVLSLPEDFPKEFPQPPDSKIILVNKSGNGTNVTYHSTDKIKALTKLYKTAAEKETYKLKSESSAGGEVTLSFEKFENKKDRKFIVIKIFPDIKPNAVILSFNYSNAK